MVVNNANLPAPQRRGVPVLQRAGHTVLAIATGLLLTIWAAGSNAQISDDVIRIGVLTDMRGAFSQVEGNGAIQAVHMAVADMDEKINAELLVEAADTQGEATVAAEQAEALLENGTDMLIGLAGPDPVAETVQKRVGRRAIIMATGTVSDALTGELCLETAFRWTPDLAVLTHVTRRDLIRRRGDLNLFIYGENRQRVIRNTYERGHLQGGQNVSGQVFITDVRDLGAYVSSGMIRLAPYYWNADEPSRTWAERFRAMHGTPPTYVQAAAYSATMHYLRAVAEAGTDRPGQLARRLHAIPVEDFYARNGKLLPNGQLQQDVMLMRAREASRIEQAWDYFRVLHHLPGPRAYAHTSDPTCDTARSNARE